ncbi:MAG: hypothetical protein HYU64_02620 [Armatimonadetes bacterium]|nr:hypothetical protein [Armatimonadota bacterium]
MTGKWLIAGILAVFLLQFAFAAPPTVKKTSENGEMSLKGYIYCIKCQLKKQARADSECQIFGHQRVLQVISASDANGKAHSELNNTILHILINEKSQMLLKDPSFEKKTLCGLRGKVYTEYRLLELTRKEVTAFPAESAAKTK